MNLVVLFQPLHLFQYFTQKSKKSTSEQFSLYKISLTLFKVFNCTVPGTDWVDLNLNIVSTSRHSTFDVNRSNNFIIGINTLSDKLTTIRKKIHLDHLNLPFPIYKHKMKSVFLPYEC
jgi:hypothetical protein